MELLNVNYFNTFEDVDSNFPTDLIVPNKIKFIVEKHDTAFGFVTIDGGSITVDGKTFSLYKDMYFSIPGEAIIENMVGAICIRKNHKGLFSLGGPTEKVGRLKYVDECSDTLLLAPILWGDPCLNYLHVPTHIDQVPHTHPSVRIGCIIDGRGYCLTKTKTHDLTPGKIFLLYPEEIHSFHTSSSSSSLRIFVFHPESDFGPTHEIHPMINKTYIDGISLRGDNEYRTLEIRQ